MLRVLITAFEPYGAFADNASRLCLEALGEPPAGVELVRRVYPVDFDLVRSLLSQDLTSGVEVALHLGQAPGAACVALEAIGLNLGGSPERSADAPSPLVPDGPLAYRSSLPLDDWAERLRAAAIPAVVSYHAGTYLCNAALYFSHYVADHLALPLRAGFLHLPLDPRQTLAERRPGPSLPAAVAAQAVRIVLEALAEEARGVALL